VRELAGHSPPFVDAAGLIAVVRVIEGEADPTRLMRLIVGQISPAGGRSRTAIAAARVGDLGIALLGGSGIAGFGSLSSIKLGLCAGPIHDHVQDAG
jgi:hypothetical protein